MTAATPTTSFTQLYCFFKSFIKSLKSPSGQQYISTTCIIISVPILHVVVKKNMQRPIQESNSSHPVYTHWQSCKTGTYLRNTTPCFDNTLTMS